MFVDFDHVFNQSSPVPIPKELVDYYNHQLPEGLRYQEKGGILSVVDENSNEKRIGKMVAIPSDDQRKILGENATFLDAIQLMNNSQTPLRIVPQDGETISFNDKEIKKNQMIINPCGNVDKAETIMYIQPVPFSKLNPTHLKNERYEMVLNIFRVPNNSVHVIKIESEKDKPLILFASIDTKSKTSNISITYNLSNAHTIRELVICLSIYNSFFEGKAFIDDEPIPQKKDFHGDPIDKQSLQFWEKVLQIEELLGLCFVPPSEDVQNEDVYLVEQLFQSLKNGIPTRNAGRLYSFQGKWELIDESKIMEIINNTVDFSYRIKSTITLLGQTFELYCFVGIFDAFVVDCIVHDDEFRIKIEDTSENKPSYVSTMYFLNGESSEEYLSDFDKAIENLKTAKSVLDYID